MKLVAGTFQIQPHEIKAFFEGLGLTIASQRKSRGNISIHFTKKVPVRIQRSFPLLPWESQKVSGKEEDVLRAVYSYFILPKKISKKVSFTFLQKKQEVTSYTLYKGFKVVQLDPRVYVVLDAAHNYIQDTDDQKQALDEIDHLSKEPKATQPVAKKETLEGAPKRFLNAKSYPEWEGKFVPKETQEPPKEEKKIEKPKAVETLAKEVPSVEPQEKEEIKTEPQEKTKEVSKAYYALVENQEGVFYHKKTHNAAPVTLHFGIEAFIHEHKKPEGIFYVVSDATTGSFIAEHTVKKHAISRANSIVERKGYEQYIHSIQAIVAQHGVAPSFKGEVPKIEVKPSDRRVMIKDIHNLFAHGTKLSLKEVRKIAATHNIEDLGYFYEVLELAWVLWYRKIMDQDQSFEARLLQVIDFYQQVQPTYSVTDSNKKQYQQYSTPAPIAALASWFVEADQVASIFEPSAGNGLFVIGAPYDKTTVNEIDKTRLNNLKYQPFKKVISQDASERFIGLSKSFDAVISNPPFGKLLLDAHEKEALRDNLFDGYKVNKLDQVMLAYALETMKDDGKAAIIIGEHTRWDLRGKMSLYRTFFNWLYNKYYVADIINIDSRKLYTKQGTAYPLMLILIDGRKPQPFGFAPLIPSEKHPLRTSVDSFKGLYLRVKKAKAYQKEEKEKSLIDKLINMLNIELNM